MFSDNKTTPGAKRCNQKRSIIPVAQACRQTPVISRRKSVDHSKPFVIAGRNEMAIFSLKDKIPSNKSRFLINLQGIKDLFNTSSQNPTAITCAP
jgi:hypothetical protein